MKLPETYELIETHPIKELNTNGHLLRHTKTGARVVLMENDDENKVFCIGFRTPPTDSTGVAHIIEHTVLCGSEKFPIKDPFVELAKGSLNTFLNAMTYPDKTLYPVASTNDKDFRNLMHVYLDAVFHPNIYLSDNYFRQEGWHYELEDKDAELTINGVVYNEMKGAYSSPDDVLGRYILNSLYPDTAYSVESGGDPDEIPNLTYEAYLDFHRKFYHPSNSYIYLYGKMDFEEQLSFIDETYLSAFDPLQVDSMVKLQAPFDAVKEIRHTYPVLPTESEKDNTFLTLNYSVGTSFDRELYIAMDVLDYALFSSTGAVVKQALIDAGIGKDVYGAYLSEYRQPYFSIVAKNANEKDKDNFLATIRRVLTEACETGIDKRALRAGLNMEEFKYREADFGRYPKGLVYCIQMFDSWLYDDNAPWMHIEAGETFRKLKEKVDSGYFESLVQTYFLDNPHATVVTMCPEKGLAEKKEEERKNALQAYKETLSDAEIQTIIRRTEELNEWQDTPDKEEDLKKIPSLTREDLKKEAEPFFNEEIAEGDTRLLYHDIATNGIVYLDFIFDMERVPEDLYAYAGIFKSFLGMVDTASYTYAELVNEINIHTGGMGASINSYVSQENPEDFVRTFEISVKVLPDHIADGFRLMREILMTSVFSDEKRNREILEEMRSRMQYELNAAGHTAAAIRALSHLSPTAYLTDMTNGLTAYRTVEALSNRFGARKQKLLLKKCEALAKTLFRAGNLMIDVTADREHLAAVKEEAARFVTTLHTEAVIEQGFNPVPVPCNEAFRTSGQVQYVCRAGNYRRHGLTYTGALRLLKTILGYDYLWNNIRVKGGAYGCMSAYAKNGDCFFVSYRDPHLKRSIEVFEEAPAYLRAFDADERTLSRFIIGAVSELDIPKSPAGKGSYALAAYLCRASYERLQRDRDQLTGATVEDVRKLADYIEAFLSDDTLCVVGAADKIDESASLFDRTDELFHNYEREEKASDGNPFGL